MNHRVWIGVIAIILVTVVGCRPRHPPHIPQPFSATSHDVKSMTSLKSSRAGVSNPLLHAYLDEVAF
ncbi:MAG: hypothetical protein OEY86_16080 [Nitrospira sp.]|nr:hypothetical protein [Nitrospira sp.]